MYGKVVSQRSSFLDISLTVKVLDPSDKNDVRRKGLLEQTFKCSSNGCYVFRLNVTDYKLHKYPHFGFDV